MKTLALALLSVSTVASEGALRAERDVPRPERLHHVPAEYPPVLRGALPVVMGMIMLDVELNEEGRPVDIKVLSGVPALDQAAVDAVKEWRYRPTIVEGRPRRVALIETVDVFPGESSHVNYFGKMLNDPKAGKAYRLLALERLEAIGVGKKEVVKALEKAAKDPDAHIREAVNELLGTRVPRN